MFCSYHQRGYLLAAVVFLAGCEPPHHLADKLGAPRQETHGPSRVNAPPLRIPPEISLLEKNENLLKGTSELPRPEKQGNAIPLPSRPPQPSSPAFLASNLDFAVVGPGRVAQTFQPYRTAQLTALALRLRMGQANAAATGTLSIQSTTPRGFPAVPPLLKARVHLAPGKGKNFEWFEHTWENPMTLEASETYAWVFEPDPDYSVSLAAGDDRGYRPGTGWVAAGHQNVWNAANVDFTFQTSFSPPSQDTAEGSDEEETVSTPESTASSSVISEGSGAENSNHSAVRG